jgi:hypothetical protein
MMYIRFLGWSHHCEANAIAVKNVRGRKETINNDGKGLYANRGEIKHSQERNNNMDKLSFTEAAYQILKRKFVVGETYSNRQRKYTVTGIRGPNLLVRFNDGSAGTLDADIQRNIITNMTRELDWLTPDLEDGSLDRRRKSMFSVGFLAAVADLQAEVSPHSSATGGEPTKRP